MAAPKGQYERQVGSADDIPLGYPVQGSAIDSAQRPPGYSPPAAYSQRNEQGFAEMILFIIGFCIPICWWIGALLPLCAPALRQKQLEGLFWKINVGMTILSITLIILSATVEGYSYYSYDT